MYRLCMLLMLMSSSALGQDLQVLLTNSEEVKSDRYDGVKGTAYFFENFVNGRIITNGAETIAMTLNYNAETKEFEIIHEDKTIQLYKPMYMRVEIHPEDNPELGLDFPVIFQRGFNMKWINKFAQMVYDGKKVKLVKDYVVEIASNEVQNVGNTVKFKRFDTYHEYFILIEGQLSSVKLKRKRILNALDQVEALEIYAKDNNIDFSNEVEFRQLLAYYETLN